MPYECVQQVKLPIWLT